MDNQFKVVFRGDILPGHNLMEVRRKVQELFRLDDQGLNKLFIGRPIAIKKNLDEATARKWCEVLAKAGAQSQYLPEDEGKAVPPVPEPPPLEETPAYGFDVAPVGSDVLSAAERAPIIDRDVPTSHLSLDAPGSDVLKEHERTPFHELHLDLSHLALAEVSPE